MQYLPTHVGGLKYAVGQAVYIVKLPGSFKARLTPIPGTITHLAPQFATVLTATGDGPRRVQPTDLYLRGYCAACDAAAVTYAGLTCPRCSGDASVPVPDHRRPQWERTHHQFRANVQHVMLVRNCIRSEAQDIQRQHDQDAWESILKQTGLAESWRYDHRAWYDVHYTRKERLERAARDGDAETFSVLYAEMFPTPAPRETAGYRLGYLCGGLTFMIDELDATRAAALCSLLTKLVDADAAKRDSLIDALVTQGNAHHQVWTDALQCVLALAEEMKEEEAAPC